MIPRYRHLSTLTDETGIFEHADHAVPRVEHGYCTDDATRLLLVLAREPLWTPVLRDLAFVALRFVTEAQDPEGRTINRRSVGGAWSGEHTTDDCWGRSIWAFGTTYARARSSPMRHAALAQFGLGASRRSPHLRAMVFAALGAAEFMVREPADRAARALLGETADRIGAIDHTVPWPWPEPRLTYANAAIAEVLIAAGTHLNRPGALSDGLHLLGWLLDRETHEGHLSVTPVGGAGPDDRAPGFDQQPIEVATMADACARARAATRDPRWTEALRLTVDWFTGTNDAGTMMWDPVTEGGYDGLTASGPNQNQGAESTLAWISTSQYAATLPLRPEPVRAS